MIELATQPDTLIAMAVVAGAAWFMGRRAWRAMTAAKRLTGGACGGCAGCGVSGSTGPAPGGNHGCGQSTPSAALRVVR